MQAVKEPTIDLLGELSEFKIEGIVNSYYSTRKNPIRIRCHWITRDILKFELRGYCLALYIKSVDTLFRVDANHIHWSNIKKACTKVHV